MARVVSLRQFTAEARAQFRSNLYEVCSGQSDTTQRQNGTMALLPSNTFILIN